MAERVRAAVAEEAIAGWLATVSVRSVLLQLERDVGLHDDYHFPPDAAVCSAIASDSQPRVPKLPDPPARLFACDLRFRRPANSS